MASTTLSQVRPSLSDHSLEPASDRNADIAAIRAVVADVELGFNTNNLRPAIDHFASDAIVVNAAGVPVSGFDAIEAAHRAAFAGFLKDQHVVYEIDSISFVRPDVAVVLKSARAAEADGTLIDEHPSMRAIYTLVRDGGRWWIAARANTLVAG